MKKILLLSGEAPDVLAEKYQYLMQDIAGRLVAAECRLEVMSLDELVFDTGSKDGTPVYSWRTGLSVTDYDRVIFQQLRDKKAAIAACAGYLKQQGIPYIDSRHTAVGPGKINGASERILAGIPSPRTVFTMRHDTYKQLFHQDAPLAYPFILKDNYGRKGRNNFLINGYEELVARLDEYPDVEFVAQQFIPNDGDYRYLVMGDKIQLIIYRQAVKGSHLNNTSKGATATLVPVAEAPSAIVADVLKACKIAGMEVAGVDVIIDRQTGRHYVLEVNSSPQLGSGAFVEEKLAAFADYLKAM